MKFVCFDTATDAMTCALWTDGALLEHHETAPRRHADRLLASMDRLLAEAGVARSALDAIGFGRGPGSFTGLRVAAGVAQGLAFALDVPVVPVSTLAVLAQGALREYGSRRTLVLLDARLGEVYAGAMRADPAAGVVRAMRGERLCRPEDLAKDLARELAEEPAEAPGGEGGWTGCGAGWSVCGDALPAVLGDRLERLDPDRLPRARDLAALVHTEWKEGRPAPAEQAFPVYLRRRVVRAPRAVARP